MALETEPRASEEITAVEDPFKSKGRFDWLIWPVVGIVAALGFLAPFVVVAGVDVGEAYRVLFTGAIGSAFGLGTTLRFATPLILVALGVAIPYRAGLFNIGGEGQLVIGATVAVLVATNFTGPADLPGSLVVPALAGAAAAGLWGAFAGYLRAWRGINEIISTIMLNFFALFFVKYLVTEPFRDPQLTYAATRRIPSGYELPLVGGDARIHLGFFIAVAIAIVMTWYVESTRQGFQLRLVGLNPALASRQGIPTSLLHLWAMALGGALAGLGGIMDAFGNQFRVGVEFSPGWGFDAIAIALLARGNILPVIPVAIFFAALRNGASVLGRTLAVPGGIVFIVQAIPVIVVATLVGYRAFRRTRLAGG
jgi:ABC-type uncharacterized transport system permease subunit